MSWLNEPPSWRREDSILTLTTAAGTDFWRKTHYGYIHHSGHVWRERAHGNFSAVVRVRASYADLYDQAGLMVLADDAHWLKCGVELTSGRLNMAVVVTNDCSDWSILPLDAGHEMEVIVRVTRLGEALMIDYSLDGATFNVIRVAYLAMGESVDVGPMACSPVGPGMKATFSGFNVADDQ
jgi:regulation of enolase protein 1 (concanavalin A-like superfamily)